MSNIYVIYHIQTTCTSNESGILIAKKNESGILGGDKFDMQLISQEKKEI